MVDQISVEPIQPDELPPGFVKAHKTTNFEFVAFLLTQEQPRVQIHRLVPADAQGRGKDDGGRRGRRYAFILLPADEEEDAAEWSTAVHRLSIAYVNGQTLVDPMLLAAKRKVLRGLIMDEDVKYQKARQQGNRPPYRGGGHQRTYNGPRNSY